MPQTLTGLAVFFFFTYYYYTHTGLGAGAGPTSGSILKPASPSHSARPGSAGSAQASVGELKSLHV